MKTDTKFLNSPALKCVLIFCIALLLQIPACMVKSLIKERNKASSDAVDEICASYGGRQTVKAPVILIDQEAADNSYFPFKIQSSNVEITGTATTNSLHKSIYDVIVYNTDLEMKGSFLIPEKYIPNVSSGNLKILLPVSSFAGIGDGVTMTVDGKDYPLSLDNLPSISSSGLLFNVHVDNVSCNRPIEYSLKLKSKGAESLSFVPNANRYRVKLSSPYTSPGFSGDFLPDEREITDKGFTAEWCITAINTLDRHNPEFKVNFVVPANQYQQATRTIKYSFLVILLIFAALFLVETVTGQKIGIIQYIVTGLSLCLFYLLLLSISEYLSFGVSYLIASLLTTGALGGYFFGFLKPKTAVLSVFSVALTYIVIYILLNMEAYTLLAGTVILFIILCIIMYFTRKPSANNVI